MSAIDSLTELFSKFPGIGPRQAKRFVYFLLTRDARFIDELVRELKELQKEITTCSSCQRFFVARHHDQTLCTICANQNRDTDVLMLVEKDIDLDNIERSGTFTGRYFVLGGSIPVLEKEPEKRIRSKELLNHIEKTITQHPLKELVLALSNTPDGDNTARFLEELLTPFSMKYEFKISKLGRGLSTGTELEYSDSETIKYAFQNRY